MPIPTYKEIMSPLLTYLNEQGMATWRQLEEPLAALFSLTEEELAQEYDSGNGRVFLDRISWAGSHLMMAGLLERPKRAHYRVSESGKALLGKEDDILNCIASMRTERRNERKQKKQSAAQNQDVSTDSVIDDENTPHESLNQAFNEIRTSVSDAILDTILTKSPYEFEKLVVKLLDRMGYGGQVKNAGSVTQASNDGGIDGIIKEDVLGLGRIHIQAKRYARSNSIGREEIQKFVGALAVAQSNKGVFITTSYYTKGAIEYVDSLNGNTNLVLIDGMQLAGYIYEYNLGMQTEQVVEIKKMDADFWDAMQDESATSS